MGFARVEPLKLIKNYAFASEIQLNSKFTGSYQTELSSVNFGVT